MNKLAWLLLTALCACDIAAAADWCVFEGSSYRLILPGAWRQAAVQGLRTYRTVDGRQAITAARYEIVDDQWRAETDRARLMRKSAELRREAEARLGSPRLSLSPVIQDRTGNLLRARFTGRDGNRRFIDLMVSSPDWIQNFYYEALGMSDGEFERQVAQIFARLEIRRDRTLETTPTWWAARDSNPEPTD